MKYERDKMYILFTSSDGAMIYVDILKKIEKKNVDILSNKKKKLFNNVSACMYVKNKSSNTFDLELFNNDLTIF